MLIVVRRLPLSIIEWKEFRVFCISLNPETPPLYLRKSHTTIAEDIKDQFPGEKDSAKTNSCC